MIKLIKIISAMTTETLNFTKQKRTKLPSPQSDLYKEEILKWRSELINDPNSPIPALLDANQGSTFTKGYTDNILLYKEFVLFKQKYIKNPNTKIPDSIGKSILNIVNGFSKYFKFNRYTWKDEMIDDAIFTCVRGVKSFKDDKYVNPHAYLTMICEMAFIQRIKKEKREYAKRYKYFITEVFNIDMIESNGMDYNFYLDMNNKVSEYESSQKKNEPAEKFCTYELPDDILDTLYSSDGENTDE